MKKIKGLLFVIFTSILFGIVVVKIAGALYVSSDNSEYMNKYLEVGKASNENQDKVKSTVSFDYSTEGAFLYGVYSASNEIRYLNIDIYGEMGKQMHEYSFLTNCIIYSCLDIKYAQPYYINPENTSIQNLSYKRYLIRDGQMFDCTNEEMEELVTDEFRDNVISAMLDYISTLNHDTERE